LKSILKNGFYIFTFLISGTTFSQQYVMQGRVVDESNIGIEAVTFDVFREDSIITHYAQQLTDSLGSFSISVEAGTYRFQIRYLGNKFFDRRIIIDRDSVFADIVIDASAVNELAGVDVVARRKIVEQLSDRLVFHVDNVPSLVGRDIVEALQITPHIHISNNVISIAGKKGIRLMLNDRLLPLSGDDIYEYLKNLSSDDVKSIEVIANPPAKYSAEGINGLINIVTKQQLKDSWNARLFGGYEQHTYSQGNIGTSTNFKHGKWELNGTARYRKGSIRAIETGNYYYPIGEWQDKTIRKDNIENIYLNYATVFRINEQLETGILYEYSNQQPQEYEFERTEIFSLQELLDSLIEGQGHKKNKIHNQSLSYYFVYDIDTFGRKLSFDADFFQYNAINNRNYFYELFFPDMQPVLNSYTKGRSFSDQRIKNYSFNLNMEHPFESISFEYGGRISGIETKNVFEQYDILGNIEMLDNTQSNEFHYKEQTLAFFVSTDIEFGDVYGQIGLRYENTHTVSFSQTLNKTNKRNYYKLFPTINIGYDIDEENSFSLYYGNRINRPSYHALNPFRWVSDMYSYAEGNPNLQPAFSDNFEISHNFEGNVLGINSNIYYTSILDGIGQLTIIEDTIYKHFLWENYLRSNIFGLDQTISLSLTDMWNARFGYYIDYNISSSNHQHAPKEMKGWSSMLSLYNVFYLDKMKNKSFTINFQYFPPATAELESSSSHNKLDAYFTWMMFEKKFSVNIYASDITGSYRPIYTTYSSGVRNSYKNYYDLQYLSLSLRYKFGKDFRVQERERKNENEMERL